MRWYAELPIAETPGLSDWTHTSQKLATCTYVATVWYDSYGAYIAPIQVLRGYCDTVKALRLYPHPYMCTFTCLD